MKFDQIVNHLSVRGFVTRKKWTGLYVYFGMDNVFMKVLKRRSDIGPNDYTTDYYLMCLDDIKADDWETIELYWDISNGGDRSFKQLKF